MTIKSDIDRMLDMLESFRDSVPGHVRQLLRLMAARCDEMETRLKAVTDQVAGGIEDWDDAAINKETKHLLSNPKNAAALEKSIKHARAAVDEAVREDDGSFW